MGWFSRLVLTFVPMRPFDRVRRDDFDRRFHRGFDLFDENSDPEYLGGGRIRPGMVG